MMMEHRLIKINVNELVGNRIKIRRKELGYSGKKMAEKLGVSQQQYSRYERGLNKLDLSYLVIIANYLDTPIYWFFEDCFNPKKLKENKHFDKRRSFIAEITPDIFSY